MKLSGSLLAAALSFLPFTRAQVGTYRYSNGVGYPDTVFSMTAVKQTGDIWFHLEHPAGVQWVAPAIGTQMKNAMMFVVYHAGTGNNVTVSPRTSREHMMPTLTNKQCDLVGGPGGGNYVDDIKYNVNVHCKNVTTWANTDGSISSLDLTSNNANFLFGIGPVQSSPSRGDNTMSISQHPYIPSPFTVDMTKSTTTNGTGAVPNDSQISANMNTFDGGYIATDPEWSSAVHAICMIVAFVIVFPLGAAWMRLWQKVGLHRMTQAIGLLIVVLGMALGIYAAVHYKTFGGHPILGIIVITLTVGQFALGALHHRKYKSTQQKTKFGMIHRFLGPAVILIGTANGFYGFAYAGKASHNWALGVLIILVGLVLLTASWTKSRRAKRMNQPGAQQPYGPSDPYHPSNFPPQTGAGYGQQPPTYAAANAPWAGPPSGAPPPPEGYYPPPAGKPPARFEATRDEQSSGVVGEGSSNPFSDSHATRPGLYQRDSEWASSGQDIHLAEMKPHEPKTVV